MLEDLTPPARVNRCKVAVVAESLKDADRSILLKAIDSPDVWPVKTLSKALGGKGVQLSETPIASHRNRVCACFRQSNA